MRRRSRRRRRCYLILGAGAPCLAETARGPTACEGKLHFACNHLLSLYLNCPRISILAIKQHSRRSVEVAAVVTTSAADNST
jgi:hypothetical protein